MHGADNILIGVLIGMVMSVPFGAIGIICIKRILARGKIAGFSSGLGVALGDTIFASIVVFGVTQLSDWMIEYQRYIEFFGGLLILVAGVLSYRAQAQSYSNPAEEERSTGVYIASDIGSMTLMAVTNPQTIIGFSAAFAAMVRFYHLDTTADSLMLVMGVFIGGISWWIVLSILIDKIRHRFSEAFLHSMHQFASIGVIIIGLLLLAHAVFFSL